jgi:hypothetical protein
MVLVARDMIWRGAEAALLHRRPYPHTKAMGDGVAQLGSINAAAAHRVRIPVYLQFGHSKGLVILSCFSMTWPF